MSSFVPYSDARTLLLAANLVPVTNIQFANEPFVQPQSSLWLSVDAVSPAIDIIDLGGNNYAERGTIIIYCCAPFGTGTDALRQLAKAVCNVYRGLPSRNPYYENASIGGGGSSEEGSYFILPVSVSFVYED